jgi:integrase
MTLVFFCGVRVDEVARLSWDKVDLQDARVTIESEASKKGRRRVNVIPENALEWLRLCKSSGKVAPNDYAQRMKRLRHRAGISYPQNAMRHCFSAYHLAKWGDAPKTAFQLGHPNPQLLYNTYYAVVDSADVSRFWEIIPDSVRTMREELAQRQKAAAEESERRSAEELSNCGQAILIEGQWVPVQQHEEVAQESEGLFDN